MEASATKPQTKSMNTPATSEQTYLRTELERRRERLHTAVHSTDADASLSRLLGEVDAALARIEGRTFVPTRRRLRKRRRRFDVDEPSARDVSKSRRRKNPAAGTGRSGKSSLLREHARGAVRNAHRGSRRV